MELPEKCLRGRNDCQPLSQVESDCGLTFICCGKNDGKTRKYPSDEFRHCWKAGDTDDMSDMDTRDIADTISVLARALSVDANKSAWDMLQGQEDH